MAITAVTVKVPAGTYWLGDPCYSVPDELWDVLLLSCDYFNVPIGTAAGHQVLGFSTAHGDGLYRGSDGNEYPVDAGLIGLVPVELNPGYDGGGDLSFKVSFTRDTECSAVEGVLEFGGVRIDTSYEEGEVDDEDDDGYFDGGCDDFEDEDDDA